MTSLIASRMVRMAAVVGGSGALAAGMLGVSAGAADASTVTCGMTVTSSVTLTHNLNCSHLTSAAALTIGAAGVTVNLNGHKITGPGLAEETDGIADKGYDGVRVENGTISNFGEAVYLEGSDTTLLSGAVVRKLTITSKAPPQFGGAIGVSGDYLTGASVSHLVMSGAFVGIALSQSQASMVTHNRLTRSIYGMADSDGTGNTWSDNVLAGMIQTGLDVSSATSARIEYNTISGTGAVGIYAYGSTKVEVAHNNLSHLYIGAYWGQYGSGTGGRINDNRGKHDTLGIYTDSANGTTVKHNSFTRGDFGIESDYPTSEHVRYNVTSHNASTGIFVYDGNVLQNYAASLSHNTADHNRFGLFSQFKTAGRKNEASHNKVLNCRNVSCVKNKKNQRRGAQARVAGPRHLRIRSPRNPFPLGQAVKG